MRTRAHAQRLRGDRGTSLVEVCIATLVMAVAVTGVIGVMGSGMSLVGHSRQRSLGVALAQERLERIHGYPYEDVALNTSPAPARSQDPASPDHRLSADGTRYDVGDGSFEPLVVSDAGSVTHIDPAYTPPGTDTEFSVYQYVTWVDDPNVAGTTDYKRITVVAVWNYPVNSGPRHMVTQSTYMSGGDVSARTPGPTGTPSATPSATPTPVATPVPTPDPGVCPGDTNTPTGGQIEVLSGSGAEIGYTNSTIVSVRLAAVDGCSPLTAELSNDGTSFSTAATLTSGAPSTTTWTVGGGDGTKTISARFRDGAGNTSAVVSETVTLDRAAPASFGGLAPSNCAAHVRSATFTWGPTNEGSGNFLTYRLFRQVDTSPVTVEAVTAGRSISNTFDPNKKPVKFWVRAYDKAGNASNSSNVITFTNNNSCTHTSD